MASENGLIITGGIMKNLAKAFVVILSLFALAGCGRHDNSFLSDLASTDAAARKAAKTRLEAQAFSRGDLPELCAAVKAVYPDDAETSSSTKAVLLGKISALKDNSSVGFIAGIFTQLPNNPDIKGKALGVLSDLDTRDSIRTMVTLLIEHKPGINFIPFNKQTRHAAELYPALFALLDKESYKYEIYTNSLELMRQGSLPCSVYAQARDKIIADLKSAAAKRAKFKASSEEYAVACSMIEVIVDVLGCLPGDAAVKELLVEYSGDKNSSVAMFSAVSLLKLGGDVPEKTMEKLAADPGIRVTLYRLLTEGGWYEKFPEKYRTQLLFAESNMAEWLKYPTEFGRPPDKIELVKAKIIKDRGENVRVYLFKYLYNDDKDGWMTGLSGPYPEDEKKVVSDTYLTFSSFTKLNKHKTADEHIDEIIGVINGAVE